MINRWTDKTRPLLQPIRTAARKMKTKSLTSVGRLDAVAYTYKVSRVCTHPLSGKYMYKKWQVYTLVNLILKKISKIGATGC